MAKKPVSIRKKIDKKMEELKKLQQDKRQEQTHVRMSKNNADIFADILVMLQADHMRSMDTLGIKTLTMNDAITALLVVGMSQFGIPLERLDPESNYMRIIELDEHNNIMSGE